VPEAFARLIDTARFTLRVEGINVIYPSRDAEAAIEQTTEVLRRLGGYFCSVCG
jgi:hypothetical protein